MRIENDFVFGETYIDTYTGFKGVFTSYQVNSVGHEIIHLEMPVDAHGLSQEQTWFPAYRLRKAEDKPAIGFANKQQEKEDESDGD